MNEQFKQALEQDRVIDITTIGRLSGRPHRVELWFHNLEGRIYITGLPGRRDWYSNLLANRHFTFHLKESVQADLPAQATPIVDEPARWEILEWILQRLGRISDLEAWVERSPLVAVAFDANA